MNTRMPPAIHGRTAGSPVPANETPSFPLAPDVSGLQAATSAPEQHTIVGAVPMPPPPLEGRALAERAAKALTIVNELLHRGHLDAANPHVINFTGYLDDLIDQAAEEIAAAAKAAFRRELGAGK